MKTYLETLLYVIRNDRVLLILKKRGLGEGLYNGIGGKVEENETPEEAVIRECKEETGIIPKDIKFMGLLEFWNFKNKKPESVHFVYVFRASDYEGELKETEEAKPIWFDINSIPYNRMWEDDKFWMPYLLKNKMFYGKFLFEDWKLISGWVKKLL